MRLSARLLVLCRCRRCFCHTHARTHARACAVVLTVHAQDGGDTASDAGQVRSHARVEAAVARGDAVDPEEAVGRDLSA